MKQWFADSRHKAVGVVGISLLLYWIGVEWPLLLATWACLVVFMPMPRVFDSWLSRLVPATIVLYALLQVAALVQLYTFPTGKFPYMAALHALALAVLLLVYTPPVRPRIRTFTAKDAGVVIGCVLFLVPFMPILMGNNSLQRLGQLGGVQIVDATVHYGSIANYTHLETLRGDYQAGRYYPSGFHIATAFIDHAVVGDLQHQDWKRNVGTYFLQYIFVCLLLAAALMYLAVTLLAVLAPAAWNRLTVIGVAVTAGVALTIMHLWAFVGLGFLNYAYIAAAVLVSVCFLLEGMPAFKARSSLLRTVREYTWTPAALLLVGFGASCSWPLLGPAFLLAALMLLWPLPWSYIRKQPWRYTAVCIPLAILAVLNLITIYLQSHYWQGGNGNLALMGGALHNFNIVFLLIGLAVAAGLIYRSRDDTGNRLVIMLVPYLLIVLGLMAMHYFELGEARYYVIKVAMLLEMMFIALITVAVAGALQATRVQTVFRPIWTAIVVLFVVFATIGMLPQPLQEVRGLFRGASGMGKPPYYDSDVREVVNLGAHGQIRDFNMTILHVDPSNGRLFAHIEPALWAHAMAQYTTDTLSNVAGSRQQSCFGKQYAVLAYGTNAPGEQEKLVSSIWDCIHQANEKGTPYYIVTDDGSAQMLRDMFGPSVEIVH